MHAAASWVFLDLVLVLGLGGRDGLRWGAQVLDDGAVDGVLVGWLAAGRGGLGDKGFEDEVLGVVSVCLLAQY